MRELTAEETAKLELLTDPEIKPKFAWDDTFQRNLMGVLLTDSDLVVQSLGLVKPDYFSNDAHVIICGLLFKYFEERKVIPPKWILQQELLEKIKDRDRSVQLHFQAELMSLYDYYVPGLDTRDYLLDKLTYFAKVQAVKVAFHKSLERMTEAPEDEKTWAFVYEQMREAMLVDRSYEPGLEYFMNIEEMFRRMQDSMTGKDRFTTSFESIDNALTGGGLFHGQIGAWIAMPGSGKSLALSKASVANILLGHKVLYLTMELDELGVSQRFTSQFAKIDINILNQAKDEVIRTIDEFKKGKDDPNQLIIKQFPGGQLDVNGIRAFHAQLGLRGWKPDLIVVDYVGEMKNDPNLKTYESAYRILRDLRGFGVEKKHCTLTCVQPNATAAKLEIGQYIDESNIGTSFDQFKPLDALWSINQQTIEKDAEVGRGFVIKHRNGRSRFAFKMGFDYRMGTLDVFEVTNERYRERMNVVQERKSGEVIKDEYKPEKRKKWKPNESSAISPTDDEIRGE